MEIYRRFLEAIRIPEYFINTEKSYLGWVNRFLRFHQGLLPHHLSEPEVASVLEHLALKRKVAGATRSQALNVLVFFFARVLEKPPGCSLKINNYGIAKNSPQVLTHKKGR